jgi:hypothetical protein
LGAAFHACAVRAAVEPLQSFHNLPPNCLLIALEYNLLPGFLAHWTVVLPQRLIIGQHNFGHPAYYPCQTLPKVLQSAAIAVQLALVHDAAADGSRLRSKAARSIGTPILRQYVFKTIA